MKKDFGKTGLQLSPIGLGLAALGRPGYINIGHEKDLDKEYNESIMERNAHEMLDMACKWGINYFDVARSYGKGEIFLSRWLQKNRDKKVHVGSKWGYYYTANWQIEAENHEIKDHSLTRLKEQWPVSRELLQPNLKMYQIHSATFESGVLENHQVLDELQRIKAEGYIIGLTLSGPGQAEVLEHALKISANGEALFGSVQATFNILEQSTAGALQKAYDSGMGVIVKEAVANGRLTDKNRENEEFNQVLKQIADAYNVSPDAVAIAFILQRGFVNVVLSGAAKPAHLRSNLKSLDIELDKTDYNRLKGQASESSDYWKVRSGLEWN